MNRSQCRPFHGCAHTSDIVCQSDMLWANVDRVVGCCRAEVRLGREVLVAPLDRPTAAVSRFLPVTRVIPRVGAMDVLRPMLIRPMRLCALSLTTRLIRRVNSGERIDYPVPLPYGSNGCTSLSVMAVSWSSPLNVRRNLLASYIVRALTLALSCENSVS